MSELVNMLSSLTTELFETDKRNLQMTRVLLLIYVHWNTQQMANLRQQHTQRGQEIQQLRGQIPVKDKEIFELQRQVSKLQQQLEKAWERERIATEKVKENSQRLSEMSRKAC